MERRRKKPERNNLVSVGFARFRVSDKSDKHRNIDPKDVRRGNMVVVDVRTTNNIDDCLLGPWERQYLIGIKRQKLRPNIPDDELNITLYEPCKVVDGLLSMPLWASRKIEGNDCNAYATKAPAWVNLLKLLWLPVSQMYVEVHKVLIVSNGELYHKPPRHLIW